MFMNETRLLKKENDEQIKALRYEDVQTMM